MPCHWVLTKQLSDLARWTHPCNQHQGQGTDQCQQPGTLSPSPPCHFPPKVTSLLTSETIGYFGLLVNSLLGYMMCPLVSDFFCLWDSFMFCVCTSVSSCCSAVFHYIKMHNLFMILLLMDIWVVSHFALLETVLQWAFLHMTHGTRGNLGCVCVVSSIAGPVLVDCTFFHKWCQVILFSAHY